MLIVDQLTKQFRQIWRPRKGLAIAEASIIGIVAALSAVLLKQISGWLGTWRIHSTHILPVWLVLPLIGMSFGFFAGMFNFLIQPGKESLLELIKSMDKGLIVDQMLGGSGGISGDFAINVDLGYLVEKGEIIGRVKDTMVAGNVYTALKQVVKIGGDADWNGSCYTPSIIVEGLSTIGKNGINTSY